MKKTLISSLLLSLFAVSLMAAPMDGDKPAKGKKAKKSCCGHGSTTGGSCGSSNTAK